MFHRCFATSARHRPDVVCAVSRPGGLWTRAICRRRPLVARGDLLTLGQVRQPTMYHGAIQVSTLVRTDGNGYGRSGASSDLVRRVADVPAASTVKAWTDR